MMMRLKASLPNRKITRTGVSTAKFTPPRPSVQGKINTVQMMYKRQCKKRTPVLKASIFKNTYVFRYYAVTSQLFI